MATGKDVMKISGAGSMAGGKYDEVVISGSGRITSAVECDLLRVSGSLDCDGPVKARRIKISGSASFSGPVEAEETEISGSSSFRAALHTGLLRISGAADVEGSVKAKQIRTHGGLRVSGDCEAEGFFADGAFKVGGLLSADTIVVVMYGPCEVGEVGGESIEFRRTRGARFRDIVSALGLIGPIGLTATSVEGDHVLLNQAKVGTVRGRDVELGDGCDVDLVEYATELKQARGATVKSARKTESADAPAND
jgi:cytoskeletal protein CcmA (bactofilin family)